ncbi:TatD DNase family protein [Enterococcus sp. AZ048]|uniref:Qat anti-phage system TatD family nuclease QatD n=1 Tax=Enterococcus sp. AZ048 TaxID=2774658 RepID=UPI003F20DAEE
MNYLDTHCHVDLAKNRKDFIRDINDQRIYTIAVSNLPSLFEKNKVIIPESKYLKHALGYHPELVRQFPNQLEKFESLLRKTRYVGEIGIDGSGRYKNSLPSQIEIFENILMLCDKRPNKILTIHSRNSEQVITEMVMKYPKSKKILHWFSGDIKYIERLLDSGCYFSINKQMLLSSKGILLVNKLPLKRILLESDFPFAYSSESGNLSDYLLDVIKIMARKRNIDTSDLVNQLLINQKKLLE